MPWLLISFEAACLIAVVRAMKLGLPSQENIAAVSYHCCVISERQPMAIEIITSFITAGLTGLLYWYIRKSANNISFSADGLVRLTMHPAYKYLAFLCLSICLVCIIGGVYDHERMDATAFVFLLLILAIFGIPGVYGLLLYYNHVVLFDEQFIINRSPFGQVKRASWADITDVVHDTNFAAVYLYVRSRERLLVQQHLKGFDEFRNALHRQRPGFSARIKS